MELIEVLKYTYKKRQAINRGYSQNAFARDLGVSPTALSQVLSGKRNFSAKNAAKVSHNLNLPIETVRDSGNNNHFSKAMRLKIDSFSIIADWYHFAILNLVEVDKVSSNEQISTRLGLSPKVTEEAVKRLLKLKLLEVKGKRYSRLQYALDAGTDIPSEALRKHNREKMELAIESLEKVSIHNRDVSSLTVTFDPSKMDKLKEEIKRFKSRALKICDSEQDSEVYSLNIQFFPLTHSEKQ